MKIRVSSSAVHVAGVVVVAGLLAAAEAAADAGDRILRGELELEAPVEAVWAAWTTPEGVRSFFAPACRIEPRVDGAYEIYFDPEAEPGRRGAEGTRILVFEPPRRLSFTWDAPPDQPVVRGQRTQVILELEPLGPERTRLRFTHWGWGFGPDWDRAYAYFADAWNGFVLPRLVHRFETGRPLSWQERPQLAPALPSLERELLTVEDVRGALAGEPARP